jgi:thioredoxin 1
MQSGGRPLGRDHDVRLPWSEGENTMSANTISTDERDFDTTVLQAREPVLVDFWAQWCPPCRVIAPIVEELAAEYSGRLRVVKVNTDENPDIVRRYGIMGNPSLLFFKDGQEAHRLVGAWPKAKLVDAIEQVLRTAGSPMF